jgi:dolichol kinase
MSLWLVYHWAGNSKAQIIFLIFLLMVIAVELARRQSVKFNKMVLKVMLPLMRKSEIKGVAGVTPLIISVNILTLFPTWIVNLSLWFLAFADPIASLFGVLFGRTKLISGKSLEGSAAAFVVCSMITYLTYSQVIVDVFMFGLFGALAELLPIGPLDDNLTMPLATAMLLLGYSILA